MNPHNWDQKYWEDEGVAGAKSCVAAMEEEFTKRLEQWNIEDIETRVVGFKAMFGQFKTKSGYFAKEYLWTQSALDRPAHDWFELIVEPGVTGRALDFKLFCSKQSCGAWP